MQKTWAVWSFKSSLLYLYIVCELSLPIKTGCLITGASACAVVSQAQAGVSGLSRPRLQRGCRYFHICNAERPPANKIKPELRNQEPCWCCLCCHPAAPREGIFYCKVQKISPRGAAKWQRRAKWQISSWFRRARKLFSKKIMPGTCKFKIRAYIRITFS